GNLLAYGVFDLDAAGESKLLARGRYTEGAVSSDVEAGQITEYVAHSWYTEASGGLNPSVGVTEPLAAKPGAYSWLKSPRYLDKVHEVGPLARMWVNGDYRNGISVIDRVAARALEAQKVANAMEGWLGELVPGEPVYAESPVPNMATGIGLTEAPRGALGHWIAVDDAKISRYQVVSPTNWNASPRDDAGQMGPIEQALLGTPVADSNQPIELLRVVHSFDPCLACSVHMVRAGGDAKRFAVTS
ncbi:MAG: nickel-dependent hydrogenase large subunit, partial [Armatimonadota bacterium]